MPPYDLSRFLDDLELGTVLTINSILLYRRFENPHLANIVVYPA